MHACAHKLHFCCHAVHSALGNGSPEISKCILCVNRSLLWTRSEVCTQWHCLRCQSCIRVRASAKSPWSGKIRTPSLPCRASLQSADGLRIARLQAAKSKPRHARLRELSLGSEGAASRAVHAALQLPRGRLRGEGRAQLTRRRRPIICAHKPQDWRHNMICWLCVCCLHI